LLGHRRASHARMANIDFAAVKRLVERPDWQPGGKGAESRAGMRDFRESMLGKRAFAERVAPVVVVADDDRRQFERLAEQPVIEQVLRLPVPLFFVWSQMDIHQVERPFRGVDDGDLSTTRITGVVSQRNLVVSRHWLAGEK